jgi:hypothetical protein
MAGSKLNCRKRTAASSLLEVLIAMILILLVFGIAMTISANVFRSSLSVKKIRAQALLQDILLKLEQNKTNSTQTYTLGDLRIEQEISAYPAGEQLIEVHLTAYDENQQQVAELQKVIPDKNE